MKTVSEKIKARRLNYLLDYLTELNETEPEAFSLVGWIRSKSQGELQEALHTWKDRYNNHEKLNCGTRACVAGHLPLAFPSYWRWGSPHGGLGSTVTSIRDPDKGIQTTVADFFGGTSSNWQHIMYADNYTGKERVCVSPGPFGLTYDVELVDVIAKIEKLYTRLYEEDADDND